MDLARVDTSATQGRSPLHRTAPASKVAAFTMVLAAVVVSGDALVVGGIGLALAGCVLGLRLPARTMLGLAAYPGLFAALYAFGTAAGPALAALVIAKAVTAALGALLLMFTTPYPQVFAPLQRFVPAVIGDALLMTYRSLFLLLEKFSHTFTAARLRAGLTGPHPLATAAMTTRSLAGVLLYSIDLSQRTYDVMRLRGYDGRLVVTPARSVSPALDALVPLAAASMLGTAITWRLAWPHLSAFAWGPLAAGTLVLLLGAALRITSRKDSR